MANTNTSVLVVGLGRFGVAVARTLDALGQDVLAVDRDAELVNRWSSQLPTVQADMTDAISIEQLGAKDFDTAVVAIGDSVESSVITAGNLLDAGITDLWAKSVSEEHARILERIGVRHIINAETDAGKRVAHLVSAAQGHGHRRGQQVDNLRGTLTPACPAGLRRNPRAQSACGEQHPVFVDQHREGAQRQGQVGMAFPRIECRQMQDRAVA